MALKEWSRGIPHCTMAVGLSLQVQFFGLSWPRRGAQGSQACPCITSHFPALQMFAHAH